jgi:hypothetical protein
LSAGKRAKKHAERAQPTLRAYANFSNLKTSTQNLRAFLYFKKHANFACQNLHKNAKFLPVLFCTLSSTLTINNVFVFNILSNSIVHVLNFTNKVAKIFFLQVVSFKITYLIIKIIAINLSTFMAKPKIKKSHLFGPLFISNQTPFSA